MATSTLRPSTRIGILLPVSLLWANLHPGFVFGLVLLGIYAVADAVRRRSVELAGWTLAELAPSRRCGVQVAGLHRGEQRLLNPGGDEHLRVGDDVLVLGSPDQIAAFRTWVNEP